MRSFLPAHQNDPAQSPCPRRRLPVGDCSTRERIRQIENQSLKKLQSLAEAQKLREVAS